MKREESKHTRNCKGCGVELNGETQTSGRAKQHINFCDLCYNDRYQKGRGKTKKRITEGVTGKNGTYYWSRWYFQRWHDMCPGAVSYVRQRLNMDNAALRAFLHPEQRRREIREQTGMSDKRYQEVTNFMGIHSKPVKPDPDLLRKIVYTDDTSVHQ